MVFFLYCFQWYNICCTVGVKQFFQWSKPFFVDVLTVLQQTCTGLSMECMFFWINWIFELVNPSWLSNNSPYLPKTPFTACWNLFFSSSFTRFACICLLSHFALSSKVSNLSALTHNCHFVVDNFTVGQSKAYFTVPLIVWYCLYFCHPLLCCLGIDIHQIHHLFCAFWINICAHCMMVFFRSWYLCLSAPFNMNVASVSFLSIFLITCCLIIVVSNSSFSFLSIRHRNFPKHLPHNCLSTQTLL